MSWKLSETLDWREPLDIARAHAGEDMALLYSGLTEKFTGRNSYLLLNPIEEISGSDWTQLPPLPSAGDPLPLWVGYLGYGMRETPERGASSPITLPDFRLVRYATLYHFEHSKKSLLRYEVATPTGVHPGLVQSSGPSAIPIPPEASSSIHSPIPGEARDEIPSKIHHLTSNFTRAEYAQLVAGTIAQIRDGNFYQANITRKFFGTLSSRQKPESGLEIPGQARDESLFLFTRLCAASPSPYAAYIKHDTSVILSSSPEGFLSIDANGLMTTRPIKGSARRSSNLQEDEKIAATLAASEKNQAENLMIVDLMRNDLARVAEPQSVEVVEQSALYSYATIHHLISTICAKKRADISAYEAVQACFPAGSMTGAPKIAAIKWCTEKEKIERGVYSGAIGWFGANNTCDLSVVIRTLILDSNRFEFQVGGGIVADSTPEDEWRETLIKARGIIAALELGEEALASL